MVSLAKPDKRGTSAPRPVRYTVNPTAFVAALLLAPIVVTLLTFWTLIGLFALFFGAVPYLVIGTPVLIWAVGRIKPDFFAYATLGFAGNIFGMLACFVILAPAAGVESAAGTASAIFGFGLVVAPLYAGTFGALYARFHPQLRLLQS